MTEPVNEQHLAAMGLAGEQLGQPYEDADGKIKRQIEGRCPSRWKHAQCARLADHEGKHARGSFTWTDEEAPLMAMDKSVRCIEEHDTDLPGYPRVRCTKDMNHEGSHLWQADSDSSTKYAWSNSDIPEMVPGTDIPTVVKTEEAINHPAHYGGADNPYEAIKVIEAWELGFNLGNTVKYVSRAGKKKGEQTIKDLKKSLWYLQREISNQEGGNDGGT